MQTSRLKHIAQLADYLVSNNILDVIISPGSRNAPLIIAFESHPGLQTHLIHDERVAAFYALGMADATGKPVAMICTSGTALLNYSPAIAEAYYRQVPLLILSADRPADLVDQGDGQTIRQLDVYHNFIVSSHSYEGENLELLHTAFKGLVNEPKGPVHINIPLSEPLYEQAEHDMVHYDPVIIDEAANYNEIEELNELENIWSSSEKKLLIIGQHHPDQKLQLVIDQLVNDPSVAVLVENTSNIYNFNRVCHNIDRVLASIEPTELENYKPDLLISIGGAVISKRIKALFRKHKPKHNWRVGIYHIEEDTYQSVSRHLKIEPVGFLEHLSSLVVSSISNFGSLWKQRDFLSQQAHDSYLPSIGFSDLKSFEIILDHIPDNCNLHMANSSVVRYCQLFNSVKSVHYYSNRGVSGIDGSTSTAAGYSLKSASKLNVLITGDISFFYDSNAFWSKELTSNFRVIVISNGGGGIFEYIPGPSSTGQAKTFFAETTAKVKGICQAYDVHYLNASSESELEKQLERFLFSEEFSRPVVLEIDTRDCNNASILTSYFEYISQET